MGRNWNSSGIRTVQTAIQSPSDTVIAELRFVGEEFYPNQVYVRKRDRSRYEAVQSLDLTVSSESAGVSLFPTLYAIPSTRRGDGLQGGEK